MTDQNKLPEFNSYEQRDETDVKIESDAVSQSWRASLVDFILDHSKPIITLGVSALLLAGLGGYLLYNTGYQTGEKDREALKRIEQKAILQVKDEDQKEQIRILKEEKKKVIDDLVKKLDTTKKERDTERAEKKEENDLRINAEKRSKELTGALETLNVLKEDYQKEIAKKKNTISKLGGEISGLESHIKGISGKLVESNKKIKESQEQRDNAKKEAESWKNKHDTKDTGYNNLVTQEKRLSIDYNTLQEQIKKKVSDAEILKGSLAKDKDRLEKKVEALNKEVVSLKKGCKKVEEEKKKAEALHAQVKKEVDALSGDATNLQKDYAKIQKENSRYKVDIGDLTNSVGDLRRALGKATDKTRELEKIHAEELTLRESRSQKEKTRLDDLITDLSGRLEQLSKTSKELNATYVALKQKYKTEKAQYEGTIKKQGEEIKTKADKIGNLEGKVEGLKTTDEKQDDKISTLEKNILSRDAKIKKLEQDLEKEGTNKAKVQSELDKAIKERDELNRQLEKIPVKYKNLSNVRLTFIADNICYVVDGNYGSSKQIGRIVIDGKIRRPRMNVDKTHLVIECKRSGSDHWTAEIYELDEIHLPHMRGKKEIKFKGEDVSNITWSEVLGDDNVHFVAGKQNNELWMYDLSSEELLCITKNDAGRIGDLAVSPGGNMIAYVVYSDYDEINACQIFVSKTSDLVSKGKRVTLEGNKYNTQPVWINGEVLVYVKEGRESDSEVQLVDLTKKGLWKDGKKWKYRNVTENIGSTWFPPVNWLSNRNKADYNPASDKYGYVLFTNEEDGIVLRHPTKTIQDGLLDTPEDKPYGRDIRIAPKGTDKHSRAVFFPDNENILAKIGDRLYRFKKVNGGYEPHFISKIDKESDFDIK